jgi:hypothetical protein
LQSGPPGTPPTYVAFPLDSGTYTPVLLNLTNVTSSSASRCQWLRVGNVVHVSGRVTVDPATGSNLVQLGISIPIASVFASQGDLAGTAVCSDVQGLCGNIIGNNISGRAELNYFHTDALNRIFWFTFTYLLTPP